MEKTKIVNEIKRNVCAGHFEMIGATKRQNPAILNLIKGILSDILEECDRSLAESELKENKLEFDPTFIHMSMALVKTLRDFGVTSDRINRFYILCTEIITEGVPTSHIMSNEMRVKYAEFNKPDAILLLNSIYKVLDLTDKEKTHALFKLTFTMEITPDDIIGTLNLGKLNDEHKEKIYYNLYDIAEAIAEVLDGIPKALHIEKFKNATKAVKDLSEMLGITSEDLQWCIEYNDYLKK